MKKPEVRVEVEPLSDQRWAKIERGIFEELDLHELAVDDLQPKAAAAHGRWKIVVLLVGTAAVAATLGAFFVRPPATAWPSLPAVTTPSRIVTGATASHLALGEVALDVSADSALILSGDDARGVLVVLDRGKVECEVAPRGDRPPFIVQAGGVRVRVVGTHFAVRRIDDSARVDVSHGTVEVTAEGHVFTLRSGETWPAPVSALAVPSSAPVAPSISAATEPSTPLAVSATVSATRPAGGATSTGLATRVTDKPVNTSSGSATPPSSTSPLPSPQEAFEAAAKLEASNPDAAIRGYRQVARGSGPWAANALFAAGRLESNRGRRAEAKELLGEYVARFPNGSNARDARELLERLR